VTALIFTASLASSLTSIGTSSGYFCTWMQIL
jgi:hypothetical protein